MADDADATPFPPSPTEVAASSDSQEEIPGPGLDEAWVEPPKWGW